MSGGRPAPSINGSNVRIGASIDRLSALYIAHVAAYDRKMSHLRVLYYALVAVVGLVALALSSLG
jgi:hypothetical protein